MFSECWYFITKNMQQILTNIPVIVSLTFKQSLTEELIFFQRFPFKFFSSVNALVNF